MNNKAVRISIFHINFESENHKALLLRRIPIGLIVINALLPVQFLTGCGEDVKIVSFTTDEATRLLSGDTTKTWLRTTYLVNGQPQITDPCDLQTGTTFFIDDSDSARFIVQRLPDFCSGRNDTLVTGYWRVVGETTNADVADRIEFVQEGDTLLMNIDMITSLYLDLSVINDGSFEQTSFEAIIIQ